MIPAQNAQIHWTDYLDNGLAKVGEVEVFDRTLPWEDHEELESSAGACTADWLQGDPRATPEGLYAQWVVTGFVSIEAHVAALEEIGKIEDRAWANTMAAAMRKNEGMPERGHDLP